MERIILENEAAIRLVFFALILCGVMLWEVLRPKRVRQITRTIRWTRNLSLIVLNSIAVRLIVPFTATGAAFYGQSHEIGLFNQISLPFWAAVVLSLIMLDMIIYFQHVIFHHVPFLWRLHKVHHIDQEIDVTTGIRFHPVEIIFSMLVKGGSILLLGTPALAVVLFEIILNGTAMFNHGNISLPGRGDKILRLFVVTPDMHRVHHSLIWSETNRNFGFNLPWWDRIFGTYQSQPAKGHQGMEIGLEDYREYEKTGLWRLLVIPFLWK